MKVDIIVVAGGGAPLRVAKQATRLSANYSRRNPLVSLKSSCRISRLDSTHDWQ